VTTDDPQIRALLADRDLKCPWCGYNLRGVAHARCPECGGTFFASDLRQQARIPALDLFCRLGGLCGLVISAILTMVLYTLPDGAPWFIVPWLPIVPGVLVLALLADWRAHRGSPRVEQRASLALWNGVMIWLLGLFMLFFLVVLLLVA